MATYERRVQRIDRVEFLVPVGEGPDAWACWVEVEKAIAGAAQELRSRGLLDPGQEPSDTDIRVGVDDENVIVYIETREIVR